MPVSFNSPPRNFFLLGSGGQQALTNFFHTIRRAGSDRFNTSDIAYSDTDQKYILSGSGKDSNTVSFGWLEKQEYDAETDPENPTNVEDWRHVFVDPLTSSPTGTTLNFMKQTSAYGGDIIIGGKTNNIPWIAQYSSNGVQNWVLSIADFWLKKGVDGFRLDVANYYFHDPKLRDNPSRKNLKIPLIQFRFYGDQRPYICIFLPFLPQKK